VTVNNNIDYPQSLHWHGIVQNATGNGFGPFYDGVPGISQCAIQPGGSFTYRFKLDKEVGTFWYHSHYGNTLGTWRKLAFLLTVY
jgi:FtsP/CotA-like multicopper oxidase with cupredoxin domain